MHVVSKHKLSILLNKFCSEMHEKVVLICVLGMVGGAIEICLSEKGALAKKVWEKLV